MTGESAGEGGGTPAGEAQPLVSLDAEAFEQVKALLDQSHLYRLIARLEATRELCVVLDALAYLLTYGASNEGGPARTDDGGKKDL